MIAATMDRIAPAATLHRLRRFGDMPRAVEVQVWYVFPRVGCPKYAMAYFGQGWGLSALDSTCRVPLDHFLRRGRRRWRRGALRGCRAGGGG